MHTVEYTGTFQFDFPYDQRQNKTKNGNHTEECWTNKEWKSQRQMLNSSNGILQWHWNRRARRLARDPEASSQQSRRHATKMRDPALWNLSRIDCWHKRDEICWCDDFKNIKRAMQARLFNNTLAATPEFCRIIEAENLFPWVSIYLEPEGRVWGREVPCLLVRVPPELQEDFHSRLNWTKIDGTETAQG